MPTYEYKCKCGEEFELFQSITSKPEAKCPACGKKAKRLMSAGAGLIFKGTGFYITDYKNKNAAYTGGKSKDESAAKAAKESSSEKSGDKAKSEGSGKSDSAGKTESAAASSESKSASAESKSTSGEKPASSATKPGAPPKP